MVVPAFKKCIFKNKGFGYEEVISYYIFANQFYTYI